MNYFNLAVAPNAVTPVADFVIEVIGPIVVFACFLSAIVMFISKQIRKPKKHQYSSLQDYHQALKNFKTKEYYDDISLSNNVIVPLAALFFLIVGILVILSGHTFK